MKTLHIYPTGVGYHIFISLALGFLFAVSISNTAYFDQISETPNVSVGKGVLQTMSGLNIFITIVSGLALLWTAYRIVYSHESKHKTMYDEYTNLVDQVDLGVQHKSHHHHHHHQHVAPPPPPTVVPPPTVHRPRARTPGLPSVF
jgi:ABC-type nickel/cobalt efflux system permease component RcnA